MDGLNLLLRAHGAGLLVAAEGDKLVIRGPKSAAPIALLLLENKAEVMAALAADWHARHREALAYWGAFEPAKEAAALAWAEMQTRWHRLHGERVPHWQCAGCLTPIAGRESLMLGEGSRVHFLKLDCLLRFGRRWRDKATTGLQALGLDPPPGLGPP